MFVHVPRYMERDKYIDIVTRYIDIVVEQGR